MRLASGSSMRFTDDSLHHRVVLSSDGLAIGEITKLFVEADWRIRAFEVKLRKEIADRIGVHRRLLHGATLEISTEQVQSIGDAVILSVPAEALHYPVQAQPSESPPAQ
jgi:sporulation protein YlmC with PRC-barrel domain